MVYRFRCGARRFRRVTCVFRQPRQHGRLRGLLFTRYGGSARLSPRRSRSVRAPGDHLAYFVRLFSQRVLDEGVYRDHGFVAFRALFSRIFRDDRLPRVFRLPVESVFASWRRRYDGGCWSRRYFCGRVCAGVFFKKLGYGLTHETKTQAAIGVSPTVMGILLLAALAFGLKLGENGALFSSAKGPGSMHASFLISLGFSVALGALMHKSKFCSVGAFGRLLKKISRCLLGSSASWSLLAS